MKHLRRYAKTHMIMPPMIPNADESRLLTTSHKLPAISYLPQATSRSPTKTARATSPRAVLCQSWKEFG
jgi:hypothetical protein